MTQMIKRPGREPIGARANARSGGAPWRQSNIWDNAAARERNALGTSTELADTEARVVLAGCARELLCSGSEATRMLTTCTTA